MRIGVLTVSLLALVAAPAAADWQRASSRHFIVLSDDTPEHVRDFTTKLELDDKAMRVLHGRDDPPPSASSRVTVIVVANQAAVAKLARDENVAGFYLPRASGSIAFTPKRGDGGGKDALTPQQVLFHEYAHHFMYSTLNDAVIPMWLSEGFAEYHATTEFTADGGVTVGKVPLYRAYGIVAGADQSVTTVLTGDPAKMSEENVQILYGRGWLLTHFFTNSDERRPLLNAYLKALESGTAPADAAKLLGRPMALQHQLALYMRQPLQLFTIPAKLVPIDPVEVAPLSKGESAIMPAFILSKRGVDAKTAPRVAVQARQLAAPYPDDPAVQNEVAEADYDAKDYAGAIAAADRVLAVEPKSPHGLMYAGLARLALAAQSKPVDAKAVEAGRAFLRRANRLDPEWAWPLEAYYFSYVGAGQQPTANAEQGLLYARELAPFDQALGIAAAYVYLKQDKVSEARRVLQPVAYDPHGGGAATMARQVIATLDKAGRDGASALIAPKAGSDGGDKPDSERPRRTNAR